MAEEPGEGLIGDLLSVGGLKDIEFKTGYVILHATLHQRYVIN